MPPGEAQPLVGHQLTEKVDDGGHVVMCSCGWTSPPATTAAAAVRLQALHLRRAGAARAARDAQAALERARVRRAAACRQLAGLSVGTQGKRGRTAIRERRVALQLDLMGRLSRAGGTVPTRDGSRLEVARTFAGLSVSQLWLAYFANGGSMDEPAFREVLDGARPIGHFDHDVLAYTLNEVFSGLGFGRPVDYWTDRTPNPD